MIFTGINEFGTIRCAPLIEASTSALGAFATRKINTRGDDEVIDPSHRRRGGASSNGHAERL